MTRAGDLALAPMALTYSAQQPPRLQVWDWPDAFSLKLSLVSALEMCDGISSIQPCLLTDSLRWRCGVVGGWSGEGGGWAVACIHSQGGLVGGGEREEAEPRKWGLAEIARSPLCWSVTSRRGQWMVLVWSCTAVLIKRTYRDCIWDIVTVDFLTNWHNLNCLLMRQRVSGTEQGLTDNCSCDLTSKLSVWKEVTNSCL